MEIAVVVNLRARHGSQQVAARCRAALPKARVLTSRSLEEALGLADDLRKSPPELLLSAGGDGSAVALINAMRAPERSSTDDAFRTAFGVLPLGTGNGWASAMGAPKLRVALAGLEHMERGQRSLPLRRFDLLEVFGSLAHFAGTGWDAEVVEDFHAQKTGPGLLPVSARNGLAGYLQGLFTRTIPRHLLAREQVTVELTNTGDDALAVDDEGRPHPLRGGERGKVLYNGPASVCAAGTAPEWGFGFRALPFAGLVSRRFCMRVYAGKVLEATTRMGALWRGEHPLPKMHSWLLTRCHAKFSRPVPFQMGGDRLGYKTEVDYALAPEQVDMLDWRALRAAA